MPRRNEIRLSRMYPKIRLTTVSALIIEVDFSTLRCSLIRGKVYHWKRTHLGGTS